jgi:hypothetical protein
VRTVLRSASLAFLAVATSGCCNTLGRQWLGSCGLSPSTAEMNVVAECLEAGHKRESAEYAACLSNKQVVHGFR